MIIIYDNHVDNCVGMLMTTDECPFPIEAIARKDVPAGAAYRIVSDDFFGDTPREEWVADFSKPDGFGSDKYGTGTVWAVVGYKTDDQGILYFEVRNLDSQEITMIQA